MAIDIRNLVTFKAVCRLKNFTKAGEELNYSQSTLSLHIQAIENELNGKVFERIGKNLVLTELGKALLDQADVILDAYRKIDGLKLGSHNLGLIRLGAQESVAMYRLQPIIGRFRQLHPEIQFVQVLGRKAELVDKMLAGELDLLFLMQRRPVDLNLVTIELTTETLGVVGRPGHWSGVVAPLQLRDLIFVYPKHDCSYRRIYNIWLAGLPAGGRHCIEALSIEAVKGILLTDQAVAILPYCIVEREVSAGELNFFPLNLPEEEQISTQLVYHKNKWLSPVLKEFADFVTQELRRKE